MILEAFGYGKANRIVTVKIGISYGSSGHLDVDVCQVEIVNRADDIFSLEYEEYDFIISQTYNSKTELYSI